MTEPKPQGYEKIIADLRWKLKLAEERIRDDDRDKEAYFAYKAFVMTIGDELTVLGQKLTDVVFIIGLVEDVDAKLLEAYTAFIKALLAAIEVLRETAEI